MPKGKRSKWLLVSASTLFVALAALSYSLLWGKLFPFTPLVLGFTKQEFQHVVVFQEEGAPKADLAWTDTLIPAVERFHGLTFKEKPRLFFFADSDTYAARSISKARFCAFPNGDIVISPWARREDTQGLISLRIYLTHELSHSLIFQNTSSYLAIWRYPAWLLEGLATYSAAQLGTSFYPTKEETYAYIREGNWMPPKTFKTAGEDDVPLRVKYRMTFQYAEFAVIVDDLIARFGKERFFRYANQLRDDPDQDAVFKKNFGLDFEAYLSDLRTRISSRPAGEPS